MRTPSLIDREVTNAPGRLAASGRLGRLAASGRLGRLAASGRLDADDAWLVLERWRGAPCVDVERHRELGGHTDLGDTERSW